MHTPKSFYDSLAEYYDLIFEDWERSMQRQGAFIAQLIAEELPETRDLTVLDAAAGIGTQSLPLAQLGFRVFSRDLPPAAITRLTREAETRRLSLDAEVADMRSVHTSLGAPLDVVIAFDGNL